MNIELRTLATFTKAERISGLKSFEILTKKGNSFFAHPFRITWMISTPSTEPVSSGVERLRTSAEQEFPVRIAFAVPKRNFKSAVKRNRIKRLLREAYRKHKQELYTALELKSVKIVAMFIYTGKEVPSYSETEGKIILSLHRLLNAIDGAGKHPKA